MSEDDLDEFLDEESGVSESRIEGLKAEIKRLHKRLRRRQGNTDLVLEAARDAMADFTPSAPPRLPKAQKGKREEIAVLHLSDWQIGAIGRGAEEEVFNTQVARDRVIDVLLPKVAKILRNRNANISKLIILWGGDNVDGSALRANQAWDVDSTVMEQACDTCPALLDDFVTALMGEVRKIELWGVPGNHGRSGPFRRDANPDSVNWDTVSTKMWIARMGSKVDDDRLTVHVAEDDFIQVVPVGNHRVLNLHGHQFSGTGGMAGIPVYSIATSIAKWTSSGAYEFDSMFFGHFHVPTTGMFGRYQWYLNGSLQTGSQFVRDVVKQKSRPAQRLVIFDPDHGPIADHVIWLDD